MEIWTDSRIVYDGRVVRLRVGDVTLDNGGLAYREVVEHPGGVCVLPFTGHSVILVRQFRIAVGEYVLEAPAGKREGEEDPEQRARLELEEETGYRAGRIIPLSFAFASIGYCNERIHLYLAFDLEQTEPRPDPEERIELVEVPLNQVRAMLETHAVQDGKTIILLYALLAHLDRQAAQWPPAPAGVPSIAPLPAPAPVRARRPFPGLWGAIGLVLLALAIQIFAGAALHVAGLVLDRQLLAHPLGLGLMNLSSMFLTLGFGLLLSPRPRRGILGSLGFSPGLLLPAAMLVLGLHLVCSEINNYMLRLVEPPEEAFEFVEALIGDNAPLWATALTLVVVAPVGEELLFRGLILHGLRARYNAIVAVVSVSVLFALLHLNIWQAPAAFAAGMVFGWWLLQTGSLGLCIFGHALLNGLGLMGGRLLPWEISGYNAGPLCGATQPLWLTAAGALLLAMSIGWLLARFRGIGAQNTRMG